MQLIGTARESAVSYVRETGPENFYEDSRFGIIFLDHRLRVGTMNREAERICGVSRLTIIRQRADNAFQHLGQRFLQMLSVCGSGDFCSASCQIRTKYAGLVHVDFVNLNGAAGCVGGVLIIMQDMSTLRAAFQQIRTTQLLLSLGELAAGVAHHIRTPLTTLGGYLQMMLNRVEEDQCAVRRDILEMLLGEVNHINNVVKELIMFAKPPLERIPGVDVNRTLEDALLLTFRQLGSETVDIVKELAPDLPCIEADPNLLKQAFINVLQNAFEAMPERGILTLRSWRHGATGMLAVGISDTGPAIPPQIISKMFEPFYTTKLDRTGLGLSITHRIVTEHGGFINVNSDEDGTRVHIYLPVIIEKPDVLETAQQQILNLQ